MVDELDASHDRGGSDPRARVVALERRVADLEQALQSCRRIGAAVGMLMARGEVDEEAAFEVLRLASERSRRPLRVVAEEVLATGQLPPGY